MLSKVALSATLAAALVLAPASLAHEIEFEDTGIALAGDDFVAEDAAVGRGLLARKVVAKKKVVIAKKAKTPKNHTKAKPAPVHPKKDISGDEGDEGNEGTVQVACCCTFHVGSVRCACKNSDRVARELPWRCGM
jgi:hypothetical protein